MLPSQGENVVAVAVEFGDRAGDGLDADNLAVLAEVDAFLRAMDGLRGYSSPLRATVVRATEFDIVVRPFVPAALLERYDERVAAEFARGLPAVPGDSPLLERRLRDRRVLPGAGPHGWRWRRRCWWSGWTRCSAGWRSGTGFALHYTGVRPVVELTGRLMVRDLRALLPLVGAATVVILLLTFGGGRGVLVALAATVSAAVAGGALFVLLAGAGTPLLILAPVFAGGLFSDYAIHMGYHLGWRGDGSGRAARSYLRLPADADRRHHGDRLPGPGRPGQHRAPVRGGDGEHRRAGRPGAGAVVDAGRGAPTRRPGSAPPPGRWRGASTGCWCGRC